MKILEKLSSTALLIAALLFAACHKDKATENAVTPESEQVINPCNTVRIINGDGSGAFISERYIYDASNRIVRINISDENNTVIPFLSYTYNVQGKAAEEIYHNSDSTVRGKQVFTYNSSNQLTRIDFLGMSTDKYYPLPDHIIINYNQAGQRTRADFFERANPNVLSYYFDYTYNQNKIFAAEYDATNTPATLTRVREYHFDNKKSAYHALGYLIGDIPDYEKHNLTYIRTPASNWGSEHMYISYQYDSLGYPVSNVTDTGIGWGPYRTTYQYNCQ